MSASEFLGTGLAVGATVGVKRTKIYLLSIVITDFFSRRKLK
jgi:hypothetical protein